ncbi:hypothetical protein BB561_002105 [Smittium simulii]|uniref:Conserved Oligomeric Golgi complex subunit 6 C-terminal domain-containing protein n=1 Tax=Smittium simulii TaxID=133385 RepID=A0A2T9YRS2_9FUNG|nr:hypothetical protein BB561_002105 [Smittium simulii]
MQQQHHSKIEKSHKSGSIPLQTSQAYLDLFSENSKKTLSELSLFLADFHNFTTDESLNQNEKSQHINTDRNDLSSEYSTSSDFFNYNLQEKEDLEITQSAFELEKMLLSGKLGLKTTQTVLQFDRSFVSLIKNINTELGQMLQSATEAERKVDTLLNSVTEFKQKTLKTTEEASVLIDERFDMFRREKLVSVLLSLLVLSPKEIEILTPRKEKSLIVDDIYFDTLLKLKSLISNCNFFLKTSNPIAVTDILIQSSNLMDSAYNYLYSWTTNELRSLKQEIPEDNTTLVKSINQLSDRPAFYSAIIRNLTNLRCDRLKKKFINALIMGGPSGVPRPIEVHASDPIRYVGDMLAWVHQAQASEIETLEIFIPSSRSSNAQTNNSETSTDSSHERMNINEILGLCMDGVCQPLELRIEQTLAEISTLQISLQLYYLILFYKEVLAEKLDDRSKLVFSLDKILESSLKFFNQSYQSFLSEECDNLETPSVALEIPEFVRRVLAIASDLLNLSQSSPTGPNSLNLKTLLDSASIENGANSSESSESSIDSKLNTVVMSVDFNIDLISKVIVSGICLLFNRLTSSISEDNTLIEYEQAIFKWNLMYYIKNQLVEFPNLKTFICEQEKNLIILQDVILKSLIDIMMVRSSLSECFDSAKSNFSTMNQEQLWGKLRDFDFALSEGSMDLTPVTSRLHDGRVGQSIRQNAVEAFMDRYTDFYKCVSIKTRTKDDNIISEDSNLDSLDQHVWIIPQDMTIHDPSSLRILF